MASRTLTRIRLVAVLLIFLLAGFWTGWLWLGEDPPEPDPPAATLIEQLPEIILGDLDEQPRSLSEWSGQSLLLNFWATWCAPCREEMPLLQQLQDNQAATGFQVIGIAVDRLEPVRQFVEETGISYPQLVGQQEGMDAAEAFGPDFIGLPFSVFVGPKGEVLGMRTGALDEAALTEIVAAMDAYVSGQRTLADTRRLLQGS